MTHADESALIAACQAGDLSSFTGLYDQYIEPLYRFLHYRTFDRALSEDLTSTTFLKAMEKINKFDAAKGTFSAWIFSIARNTLTDHFRTNHPNAELPEEWEIAAEDDTRQATEKHLTQKQVREALSSLDPLQRDIITMRMWDGLSYQEIAEIVGKSEGNCKVIYSRTLKELRGRIHPAAFLLLLTLPTHLL